MHNVVYLRSTDIVSSHRPVLYIDGLDSEELNYTTLVSQKNTDYVTVSFNIL